MMTATDISSADRRSLRQFIDPIANRELALRLIYLFASFAALLILLYEATSMPYSRELAYWQAVVLASSPVAAYVVAEGLLWLTRQRVWGWLFRPYESALARELRIPEYRALAEAVVSRTVKLYDASDDEGNALNWIFIEPVLRRALIAG